MPSKVDRQTVDLTAYPDLVVIYLGMRVRTLAGIKTLFGLGPQINKAGAGRPEGLLHYENNIIFSLFPLYAPALLATGWSWTAATFWRATADRFWFVSLGHSLYAGPIELWLAPVLTALAVAGLAASVVAVINSERVAEVVG